jgi:hypothetical protein
MFIFHFDKISFSTTVKVRNAFFKEKMNFASIKAYGTVLGENDTIFFIL